MQKQILKMSFFFLILGLVSGVFYREFTKFNSYTAYTTLSVVHTHLLALGFLFLLILYSILKDKNSSDFKIPLYTYSIGLFITCTTMTINGIFDVLLKSLDANPILSGISGIGHILLGGSIVWISLKLLKKAN